MKTARPSLLAAQSAAERALIDAGHQPRELQCTRVLVGRFVRYEYAGPSIKVVAIHNPDNGRTAVRAYAADPVVWEFFSLWPNSGPWKIEFTRGAFARDEGSTSGGSDRP